MRPTPATDYLGIALALVAVSGCALAAGVLSSAVPFLADLLALRRVPALSFSQFMSINPVVAVLIGYLVLGQTLTLISWLSLWVIVAANAVALSPKLQGGPA